MCKSFLLSIALIGVLGLGACSTAAGQSGKRGATQVAVQAPFEEKEVEKDK